MNTPDLFALGGDQRDDAVLLTLFREWRAGMRDIEGPRLAEETEDQYDNQVDPSVCCCLQPSVSFARQRTSAAASARHRGEKIYWSAQRPPKGVARCAAAAAVTGARG